MKKISILVLILFLSSLLNLFLVQTSFALEFDPGFVVSDDDLINYQSMSVSSIQEFLEEKNGPLKDYQTEDVDGQRKTTAEIIFQASQENKINSQVILVLLQKEQSLIENPFPSQYNFDWACGYHRPDGSDPNDPALQSYKGFVTQIYGAAGTLRWYLDNYPTPWLRIVGQTYDLDGYKITPQNLATVALYNYTPHYQGNYRFWSIWQDWFSKNYPDGSLLQVKGDPGIWLIQWGKRRAFLSRAAFLSRYSPDKVITVALDDLRKYEIGQPIKFPQYSLLRSPRGTVYLLVDDQKRGFKSKEALMMMGFNPEEIIDVDWEDLNNYPETTPITISSIYPAGALLQDRMTGAVYYVEEGKKYPVLDRSILKINFSGRKIIPAAKGELEKYEKGEPIRLKDGELVKSPTSPVVYVIANGFKRPIISGEVFENLGYKWENIVVVPQVILDILHPTGEIIKLN